MDAYDYLRFELGRTSIATGIAKLGLVSLVFIGGYVGGGSDSRGRGTYSTKGVDIVSKNIEEMATGLSNMEFLEVNHNRLYIPNTDGNGNIKTIFRVDKLVLDLDGNKKYYEGIVFRLQEEGQVRIDTKSLDAKMK
ncbi:hypothetical protein HYX16_03715 [Candidatus Woesearchaeota archaeon]|nr:hypothetical protein [Candidatus Woesearchaeota archaeon]